MNYALESLFVGHLTNLEAGQLLKRHLNDLETIDPALLIDVPYNNYITRVTDHSVLYTKALKQVQANEFTAQVVAADEKRDNAVYAFETALKLYKLSDVDAEVAASRSLKLIFNKFTNIKKLNYEAESMAIDKLLEDLATDAAVANINLLDIARWVTGMRTQNDAFKDLFGTRIQGEAMTETYSMKLIRAEAFVTYRDFCGYVLSMTKATEAEMFIKALSLINTARKYYADLLARRTSTEEPATTE